MIHPNIDKLVVLLTLIFGIYHGQSQDYNLDVSLSNYNITKIQKPGYLQPIKDPTFNTKIIRITGDVGRSIPNINGEVWPDIFRHGYSTRQPWNADESILWLEIGRNSNDSPYVGGIFLDGETYAPIKADNIIPPGSEHRWHPTDPDIILFLRNDGAYSWSYSTGNVKQLISINGYSNLSMGNTGNWTHDGNSIAVSATKKSNNSQVVFVLDVSNKIKYNDINFNNSSIDHLSISPLGNYILVRGNFGDGGDRVKVYDLFGNQVGPYWSGYGEPSHEDLAIDQFGDEVAVGVSKSKPNKGKLIKRRLSDGKITVLTSGGWPPHTSARSIQRPGWVFASTSASTNYPPYFLEIIAVKLDGSRVERICHTRNSFDEYLNQAQPCPSPSGNRVLFATDWGANNVPIQTYIADFRN